MDYKNTKEWKCWESLKEVCEKLQITEDKMSSLSGKDLTEFWEPFLERVFKLGICFKQTAKLKEIRMHWIRPIFFMGAEKTVKIDGKEYEPNYEATSNGFGLFRSMGFLISKIYNIDQVGDEKTFKKTKKELQDLCGGVFKDLGKYLKVGYKDLKIVIKDVLKPLRDLRRANYNYFCQYYKELGFEELNLLYDRKLCNDFRTKTTGI